MKKTLLRTLCLFALLATAASAQQVIPLYTGNEPGATQGGYPEQEYFSKAWNTEIVANVTKPTLTVFRPSSKLKNGTAVVICPGGGFMALSIASEGTEVAQYLAARGVTAFVLKYRLAHTESGDAGEEFHTLFADKPKFSAMLRQIVPQSIDDGLAAVIWVRRHAAQFGVSPDRVGIMGFSAGGGVTTAVALHYKPEGRPAFVAPIYMGGAPIDTPVPADAPPMFIAAATDDNLGLAPISVALYQKWAAAQKSVELHMYAKGGHGFGMRRHNLPTDHWIDRFADWLQLQGFLNK
ncbi:MAG TPA: alpha/beta hydrolase [Terracidiphilus sp.]|nr:alpha/beta hydrolase [Terracidiphilus sp.]